MSQSPDPPTQRSAIAKRKPKRTFAIPKVAFRRMVQEIANEHARSSDMRFQRAAFDALQESAEQLVTKQFVRCSQLSELCKLDTVRLEHWRFVQEDSGNAPCLGKS
jgi:histone H3/H4